MHTQARSYKKKAYICGNVMELYSYKTPIFRNIGIKKSSVQSSSISISNNERSLSSIYRSKVHLRRLVNANSGNLNKFLTLTFAENLTDINEANRLLRLFMYRLRRFFPPLQYIAVPEFQKRGAVHYHIMCNLPYTDNSVVANLWSQGFVNLRRINKAMQVGRYISKYLTKNAIDGRLSGKKCFWATRKLTKPREILDNLIDATLILLYPENRVLWNKTFVSFRGEVDFSLLSLT